MSNVLTKTPLKDFSPTLISKSNATISDGLSGDTMYYVLTFSSYSLAFEYSFKIIFKIILTGYIWTPQDEKLLDLGILKNTNNP